MGEKQYIKKSEARILLYLNTADSRFRYIAMISQKLNIEYGYLIKLVDSMKTKQWVRKTQGQYHKTFLEITGKAPLKKAMEKMSDVRS